MNEKLEKLVREAKQGDRNALENLVQAIQHRIYGLALKMLYHPQDAEDATQEILIRIITHLGSFGHRSAFDTWALKVASNHLLGVRRKKAALWYTFEKCQAMIEPDIPDTPALDYNAADQELIVREMRLSCMQGLLQCLDWEHRIVYILGETMDFPGPEGGAILGIRAATFRKRLSRAREKIRAFISANCDLYEQGNPCNCLQQGAIALRKGVMDLDNLPFARHPAQKSPGPDIEHSLKALDRLSRETAIMRSHPDYEAPQAFIQAIRRMLDSGEFQELRNNIQ
ncbi:MAG: sigma-70 family RNA polymerase sigma factor [Desulfatibacillum sp.]|nr:sigma-70 family RNA polymerase sigma factor [Desulfatibacillum sp.]